MKTSRTQHYLYKTWAHIKSRCYNEKCAAYRWYGARGIGMCADWIDDPQAFLDYIDSVLGPRPPGHSLDRIDNDGDYIPGNLRWATQKEQLYNSRSRFTNFTLVDLEKALEGIKIFNNSDDFYRKVGSST